MGPRTLLVWCFSCLGWQDFLTGRLAFFVFLTKQGSGDSLPCAAQSRTFSELTRNETFPKLEFSRLLGAIQPQTIFSISVKLFGIVVKFSWPESVTKILSSMRTAIPFHFGSMSGSSI